MKVYKFIEDDFCIHSKESLYLKKGDIIFIEKCFIPYVSEYWERNNNYKEVNILTKLIRDNESKTINIVEPKLKIYGLYQSYSSYDNFEMVALNGIKEGLGGGLKIESRPIEDITIQYLRGERLKQILESEI